jgi:hypothetical protein
MAAELGSQLDSAFSSVGHDGDIALNPMPSGADYSNAPEYEDEGLDSDTENATSSQSNEPDSTEELNDENRTGLESTSHPPDSELPPYDGDDIEEGGQDDDADPAQYEQDDEPDDADGTVPASNDPEPGSPPGYGRTQETSDGRLLYVAPDQTYGAHISPPGYTDDLGTDTQTGDTQATGQPSSSDGPSNSPNNNTSFAANHPVAARRLFYGAMGTGIALAAGASAVPALVVSTKEDQNKSNS